ncbi:TRAP transporter large permease [Seohaeicola zhoushanensis]|uniref:TRAP transporter large permease protein n=1 Tax=Seohaeicola zhoushanensis TaxID=1569283 RepID=A0A8J3M608_9RHOB|nr:TRAP transporter large permease [Seohaeicola zhoushanensis]GHF39553.1 C4-dicarboxylate ABC transporter permease [Seohaeicola zhoushanensis]
MSAPITGLVGLLVLLVLIGLRVPVAIAMGTVGIAGGVYLNGWFSLGFVLGSQPFVTSSSYALSVIPLFVMMGAFASRAGLSAALYRSLHTLIGHWRGGLASATIGACALFGAVCGSSLATAATMSRVAVPEMTAIGYDRRLTSGALAAGGTLGILIPPSIIMVIFALLTEQSIGRMFLAGMIPGILAALLYIATVTLIATVRPDLAPRSERNEGASTLEAMRQMSPILGLFGLVMGGIYLGFFSPTEAAGVGAFGAIVLAALRKALTREVVVDALIETASTTGMLFMILIGTSVLQFFIETSTLPRIIVGWIGTLGLGPTGVILLILLIYVILGCFLDSLSMMLITLPLVYPIILDLGIDPIWFGVLVVSVVEIGLITPPLGMNLYVIASSVEGLKFETVAAGVVPFLLADFVRIALLVAFPALSLLLPSLLM